MPRERVTLLGFLLIFFEGVVTRDALLYQLCVEFFTIKQEERSSLGSISYIYIHIYIYTLHILIRVFQFGLSLPLKI
jgi:hypothetical protein